MMHSKSGKAVRCCNVCIGELRKSTVEIDHVESQLSREIQAKNQENFMRRDLEEKLKQTEDSSKNALDFANREIASLRQQLNESASESKRLETDCQQKVSSLTTEVYWNKQKIAEAAEEIRKLKGEKEVLLDTCKQLQSEHSSALASMELNMARNSFGSSTGSVPKSFEAPTSFPSFASASGQLLELEATVALQRNELIQAKSKVNDLMLTLKARDEHFEALQTELQQKNNAISELSNELSSLKTQDMEQAEDLTRSLDRLRIELERKDKTLKLNTDETEDLRTELAKLKQDHEEGMEKLMIAQELNDELFDDLRLIKQFLALVTQAKEAVSELNPANLSSAQVLHNTEKSSEAKALIERVANSLEIIMDSLKGQVEDRTTAHIRVKGELAAVLGQKQLLQDKVFAIETDLKNLQDAQNAESRNSAKKLESMRQALAAKTALCDSLTHLQKQAEEKLTYFQIQRDKEQSTLSRKQAKAKRRNSEDVDFDQLKRENERLTDEASSLKSEVARLKVQAKDFECKLVDQSEKRRRLEQAYDDIKGYAPEYVKDIISQATKYDHKYATIEALVTQVEELKDQLRSAQTPTGSGIQTAYLTNESKPNFKKSRAASQDTELKDWDNTEEARAPRERCTCRVF